MVEVTALGVFLCCTLCVCVCVCVVVGDFGLNPAQGMLELLQLQPLVFSFAVHVCVCVCVGGWGRGQR